MVTNQIITPATFTPWIEIDRNYCRNPRPSVIPATGWTAAGGLSIDGEWVVYTASITTTGYIFLPVFDDPIAIGDVYTMTAIVRNDDPLVTHLRFAPRNAAAYVTTNAVAAPVGQEVEMSITTTSAVAIGLGDLRLSIVQANAAGAFVARPAGSSFRVRRTKYARGPIGGPFYDGNTPNDLLNQYAWTATPGDSATARSSRVQLAAAVTSPVYETITLTSPYDSISFRGEPSATGFVYDNESLQRWYKIADIEAKTNKRPNAHGAYGLGQTFTKEHRPLISGAYFGLSSADAKSARERLVGMFNDGLPITMSVTDEAGLTSTRQVWLADYDAPFIADFSYFTFDLELIAPDSRRYGASVSVSTGMPTAGSGLIWNLGTAPSGLYFDWGTAGEPGIVSFTNTGKASTYPRIEVAANGGSILNGFRLTEIETGRELIYVRTVDTGQTIVLDSRTQRANLGAGDVTAALSKRQWFEIPRGALRRYQITPLGSVTGAPTITLYTAPANL